MSDLSYDLVVIGSGPAGEGAAMNAVKQGWPTQSAVQANVDRHAIVAHYVRVCARGEQNVGDVNHAALQRSVQRCDRGANAAIVHVGTRSEQLAHTLRHV